MSQPAISEDAKRISAELTTWMRKQFGWSSEKKHLWKDDWTLIVKLHAMIETCLNGALVKELDRTGLASVIAKLDTSNPSTGKVAFARALGIMLKASAVFLQKLSELRNICVHDVRNFDFNLIDHLTQIGKEKRNDFLKACRRMVKPEYHATSPPQELLLIGAMSIMLELMVHDLLCKNRDLERQLLHLKAERFDALDQSAPKPK
jgi:hypothetical protein